MRTVIIGGGIHGITIALKLLEERRVTHDQLSIIDPFPPAQRWKQLTNAIDMEYLRSPLVHHVHPDPYHLKKFAKSEDYAVPFSGYYQRPDLEMFNAHIDSLVKAYNLASLYIQDTIQRISPGWRLHGEYDCYDADRLILATGINHLHHLPEWIKNVSKAHYQHVFTGEVDSDADVIIGGGITAAHLARKLLKHHPVTLIMRHPFRIHELDADPGWLGPKNMNSFQLETDYTMRRQAIQSARHRGSIPAHLTQSLKHAVQLGQLTVVTGQITSADHQIITLEDGRQIPYHKMLLATGCSSNIQQDPLICDITHAFSAPTAPCGFPVVTKELEWLPGLYVSGPLAELELGPVSRNIIGARHAATIISNALKNSYSNQEGVI